MKKTTECQKNLKKFIILSNDFNFARAVNVLQMTGSVASLGCGSAGPTNFKKNTLKNTNKHYGWVFRYVFRKMPVRSQRKKYIRKWYIVLLLTAFKYLFLNTLTTNVVKGFEKGTYTYLIILLLFFLSKSKVYKYW